MRQVPRWVEALLIKALKTYLPPEALAEAFDMWRTEAVDWARAQAAATANGIDDMLVDKFAQALSTCQPDMQFLCDLVSRGEHAMVDKLRELAKLSETELDDAAVDLFEKALFAA